MSSISQTSTTYAHILESPIMQGIETMPALTSPAPGTEERSGDLGQYSREDIEAAKTLLQFSKKGVDFTTPEDRAAASILVELSKEAFAAGAAEPRTPPGSPTSTPSSDDSDKDALAGTPETLGSNREDSLDSEDFGRDSDRYDAFMGRCSAGKSFA